MATGQLLLGKADDEHGPVEGQEAVLAGSVLIGNQNDRFSTEQRVVLVAPLASAARVGALIDANVDPVSGQPELKAAPVSVQPYKATWFGFAIGRTRPENAAAEYWATAPSKSGWRTELAGLSEPQDWDAFVRAVFKIGTGSPAEILAYHDRPRGQNRFAIFDGEHLIGALFAAPSPVNVSRSFAADKLGGVFPSSTDRLRMLAGRAGAAEPDRGAVVCSCFEIGFNQIVDAVTCGGCISLDAVGAALKAGTNCGSCRPEIGRIIHDHAIAKAG